MTHRPGSGRNPAGVFSPLRRSNPSQPNVCRPRGQRREKDQPTEVCTEGVRFPFRHRNRGVCAFVSVYKETFAFAAKTALFAGKCLPVRNARWLLRQCKPDFHTVFGRSRRSCAMGVCDLLAGSNHIRPGCAPDCLISSANKRLHEVIRRRVKQNARHFHSRRTYFNVLLIN